MDRLLHRQLPAFRLALGVALLAWAALPFDAFAHSLAMTSGTSAKAPMAMVTSAASPCDAVSMPTASHAPHAFHPGDDGEGCCTGHGCCGGGHGCCASQGCYCASSLSGIADVSYLSLNWQPTHRAVLMPTEVAPALTHAPPPLRPPIR